MLDYDMVLLTVLALLVNTRASNFRRLQNFGQRQGILQQAGAWECKEDKPCGPAAKRCCQTSAATKIKGSKCKLKTKACNAWVPADKYTDPLPAGDYVVPAPSGPVFEWTVPSTPAPAKDTAAKAKTSLGDVLKGDHKACAVAKMYHLRPMPLLLDKNKDFATPDPVVDAKEGAGSSISPENVIAKWALKAYTGTDYKTINNVLRNFETTDQFKNEGGVLYDKGANAMFPVNYINIFISCALKGLNVFGRLLTGDHPIVYRVSASVPAAISGPWGTVGSIVQDKGFASTSGVQKFYNCEAQVAGVVVAWRFKIYLLKPDASKCKDVSFMSSHADEKEVLCAPNTAFKVIKSAKTSASSPCKEVGDIELAEVDANGEANLPEGVSGSAPAAAAQSPAAAAGAQPPAAAAAAQPPAAAAGAQPPAAAAGAQSW